MKLSLFTSSFLISSAMAFAPAGKPLNKSPTMLDAVSSYEKASGAMEPVGFFDPFDFTVDIDDAEFQKLRAGEVKNGRAAMLAVVGYIVPELFRWPGEIKPGLAFADIPNGVGALTTIPSSFWIVLCFFIGAADYLNSDTAGYIETLPIDLDDKAMETRRLNEISNGRLAMLAFWELVRHDLVRNADGMGDHLIYGLPFLYHD